MISAKSLLVTLCLVCAMVALVAASFPTIENFDGNVCKTVMKDEACMSCCKEAGFNGYDEKRSANCLCIAWSGAEADMTSLSEVMEMQRKAVGA